MITQISHVIEMMLKIYFLCALCCTIGLFSLLITLNGFENKFKSLKCFTCAWLLCIFVWYKLLIFNPYNIKKHKKISYLNCLKEQVRFIAIFLDVLIINKENNAN